MIKNTLFEKGDFVMIKKKLINCIDTNTLLKITEIMGDSVIVQKEIKNQ